MPASRRRTGEAGFALPSLLALGCAAAVVAAGVAFLTTGRPPTPVRAQPAAHVTAPATTTIPVKTTAPPAVLKHVRHTRHSRPTVRRAHTYVEVYNNSGITGLAGRTAARASGAGWQVVGADNWYGTIPASTVYYPPQLHAAAKLLAHDLGIHRLRPAIAPMKFDRLTVILTSGYR